jgi:hypothetical protein
MNRKGIAAGIGLALIVFFAGCAGEPKRTQDPVTVIQPLKPVNIFQIQDHAAEAAGGEIPQWVDVYMSRDTAAIEALPEYQNKYVFVASNEGSNFYALSQWSTGFMVRRDLPRLVASRILARLTAGTTENPDTIYGSFFEEAVKKSFDSFYTGAIREDDFWLLVQYLEADGETLNREVYRFLILITIDKAPLESQINGILSTIPADTATRDQTAAINHVKETLYQGF